MKVRRKKSVVADWCAQNKRLGVKNLRTFLAAHRFLKFLIELANRNPDQFQGGFGMGFENGHIGHAASERTAQAPVLIRTSVGLQGANVGQPLQQSRQSAQGPFFKSFWRAS